MKLKNLKVLLPILIFLITFVPRLYRLNNPVADWHSWRQADTAAVARNFVKSDFNLLFPQSDSLQAMNQHALENPNRWFINEFPLYNAIVALVYKSTEVNPAYARLVSIFFASLGATFLYLLTLKLFNRKTALLAALFYALNPYNIFYGRVIMPDPAFVSLSIISLYLTIVWVKSNRWSHAIILSFIFATALLVKPYAIFMIIPMAYWFLINKGLNIKTLKNKQLYIIAFLSLLPFLLWRRHVGLYPEGTFATTWLLNQSEIRFTGAFFRWLIFERLNRLIFATGGFVLFILGFITSYTNKNRGLIFVWTISIFLYMTIFAKGNVTHDYYQLPIMPVGSILVSFGFWFLVNLSKKTLPKILNLIMATSLLILSFAFGWYEVRGFFNINVPQIVAAGQAVDRLTSKDALVIAPYASDPAFLYQTNRYGWPNLFDLNDYLQQGATHYVSINYDDVARQLEDQCELVDKTPDYIIINLQPCKEFVKLR